MKKLLAILLIAALTLICAACGNGAKTNETTAPESNAETDVTGEAEPLTLRVIDGAGTGRFTLAGAEASAVYTAVSDELTVYLNGRAATPADLQNGMTLTVEPGYELLETWPAQFAGATVYAENPDKDDYGDLCGLYLTVLEDLWTNDAALNSGITYISVDLDDAPGSLTDGEKAALAWIFAGRHDAQPLTFGFEELKENGYVNEAELYWPEGVLFSIKAKDNVKQSAKKITFDAEKWRSGTGAIFFNGCTAQRGKGAAWEKYETGSFAIA
ncbi:MAG: hypothetical protein IJK89_06895 [Clostridia bacterium]|nr:hypothetical protein [Clostridia bacterium]